MTAIDSLEVRSPVNEAGNGLQLMCFPHIMLSPHSRTSLTLLAHIFPSWKASLSMGKQQGKPGQML